MGSDLREAVTALAYVVVSAADLDAWATFAQDCLGLVVAPGPEGGADRRTLFLRADERSWRLAIEQGADGGLVALGLEVATHDDLTRLCSRLEEAGFPVKEAPELAAQRRVSRLVQVSDPTGIPLEFFCGAAIEKQNFVSPRGARFVTGAQGIGHGVVLVNDTEETDDFYLGLLGFRLSDVISLGPAEAHFTSPSPRHHSLAYGSFPGMPGGALNHIMLEVDDIDVVGRALDYCLDHDVTVTSMLGKHTNDHMISFYCQSPSGLAIEYGVGGRQIDNATHQVGRYDAASFWGHRPPGGRDREAGGGR
jgi:3,4-dihydroxy-9,10-secoandrosta-1,3,5(10)-triene-9,17-dione 4,5-dioxygenase